MSIDLRKEPLPHGWYPIRSGRGALCVDASVKAPDDDTYRLSVYSKISDAQFEEAIQILRLMWERGKK